MQDKIVHLHQKQALHPGVFAPSELQQILRAYSEGVLKKHWKNDSFVPEKDQATFYILNGDDPIGVFEKRKARARGSDYVYRILDQGRQIHAGHSFLEALGAFRDMHWPKHTPKPDHGLF